MRVFFFFKSNERVQRESAAECACVLDRSSFPAETCGDWESMSALVPKFTEIHDVLRNRCTLWFLTYYTFLNSYIHISW